MDVGGYVAASKESKDWEGPTVAHRVNIRVWGQSQDGFKSQDDGTEGLTDHCEVGVPLGLNQRTAGKEDENWLLLQLDREPSLNVDRKRKGGE